MMTLTRIRKRRQEGGFTLIELLVVILIVAILMAVAVAAFTHNKGRALDSSAQQQLAQLESSARGYLADNTSFSGYDPSCSGATQAAKDAQGCEPDFTFAATSTQTGSTSTVAFVLDSPATGDVSFADQGNATCYYDTVNPSGVETRSHTAGAATCDPADAPGTAGW